MSVHRSKPARRPQRVFLCGAGLLALLASGCAGPGGSPSPSGAAPSSPPSAGGAKPGGQDAPERIGASAAGEKECGGAPCVSVSMSGDFLLHEGLWRQAQADAKTTGRGENGMDFGPLIAAQKPFLKQADLSLCQMETPVAEPKGPFSAYPAFSVPPQILGAAKEAGYDACTAASNHSIDQGTAGLERTYRALDRAGLQHTGTNLSAKEATAPAIMTAANGARVAVITGTYGLNGLTPEKPWQVDMLDPAAMIAKAKAARKAGADIVIANMHAGEEYASQPNAQQVKTGRALADSGQFDLVYGEHTHSVLPIEKHNGRWIVYGLGNSVTELSPWYPVNNEGLMVNAVFAREGGRWTVRTLRWAPSRIAEGPYRWCPVGAGSAVPGCATAAQASESRQRTARTVNSMGADRQGAVEWTVPSEAGRPGAR